VRRTCVRLAVAAVAAVLVGCAAPRLAVPVALTHAHAHNDYEHARPLLDAIDRGFCSVEADVWSVDGRLLVAHDREDATPDRTLEAVYLEPLRDRVRANGGRVFPLGPQCTLLVDVKSDAVATYEVLRNALARYADVITSFRDGKAEQGAVLVIISGNGAPAAVQGDEVRYAALDGRLLDLRSEAPPELIPWVSLDWSEAFRWMGDGPMPEDEQRFLLRLVSSAHEHGRKLRFWNTPDRAEVWQALWDAKVDLIGADDLAALEAFLRPRELVPGR